MAFCPGVRSSAVGDTLPPMTGESELLDTATELMHYMIARATDGGQVDPQAYARARKAVLADSRAADAAPQCVRMCREPDAVWSYVKAADPPLDSYESRRQFFRAEFEPLLVALEDFDSAPLDAIVRGEADKLTASSILAGWDKALARRTSDPEGAITAARALLESTCKTILDDRDEPYNDRRDDLPALYKRASEVLGIAPSQHTEEQFRAILGACTTIVRELGSLRNRISDSHGPGRKSYRPAERHAALAVNLAGSMALFLMQTHEARSK